MNRTARRRAERPRADRPPCAPTERRTHWPDLSRLAPAEPADWADDDIAELGLYPQLPGVDIDCDRWALGPELPLFDHAQPTRETP